MGRRLSYHNEIDPGAAAWTRELMAAGLIPEGEVDERSIAEVQADDLRGFTQCHFFAGIGGWPLALRLAGWPADRPVWTGSCPCQPFSSAGKRQGTADERHLWPEFFRLIKECRPPVVFGEQVASAEVVGTELEAAFALAVRRGDFARANKLAKRLAQSKSFHFHRRWVDGVRADLEGEGYAFGASVLGAHSVGAPHIRQRLYWVADAGHGQRRRSGQCESGGGDAAERVEAATHPERCGGAGGLADAEQPRPQGGDRPGEVGAGRAGPAPEPSGPDGSGAGFWSAFDLIPCRDGKARRVEPGTFPLAHGLPGRVGLLRGYGNAIVAPLAAIFIQAYLETQGER